jgi:hypothetical protein
LRIFAEDRTATIPIVEGLRVSEPMEANSRFALKARAQCRLAFDEMAEIRDPRPEAFVKQANIADGRQQVIVRAVTLNPWPAISARVSWPSRCNVR